MDIETLKTIIDQGESEKLEFKKSTAKLHGAFETITAFLNGMGGTVLIGLNDNGKIVGQEVSDSTKREIARELAKIEPTPQLDIRYINFSKTRTVIALTVTKGMHAPYTYDGRAFQRSQSSTEKMSQHRYEQLLIERRQLNYSWEDYVTEKYDINSLDKDQIYQVVSEAVRQRRIPASALNSPIEDILSRYKLIESGRLKNAAVVLFAKEENLNFAQCLLKMTRFKGKDKSGEIIDSKQIYVNAFAMLDEADTFLRKHLSISSFFEKDQFQRIDKSTLPVLSVREALVNAICHRDYSTYSGSIMLAIYDNRLEIWNNGSLPSQLKLEDLSKEHRSWARNKLIAGVFYSMRLIETWGTGTNRMIRLCKEDGLPAPVFKEDSGGISVIFKFKTSIGAATSSPANITSLSERQEILLKIIKEHGEVSMDQIVSKLENPPSRRMLQKDLNQLKDKGKIELQGSGRGAAWKYNP